MNQILAGYQLEKSVSGKLLSCNTQSMIYRRFVLNLRGVI